MASAKEKDAIDPDRHFKRINTTVGITHRIKQWNSRKKKVVKQETQEERIEKTLKESKEERTFRSFETSLNERFILAVAAYYFGIEEDTMLDCLLDSHANQKTLQELSQRDGSFMVLMQFQPDDPPGLTSGRFNPNKQFQKVDMALFSKGQGKKIAGKCILAYRLTNTKAITKDDIHEEVYFTVLPEDMTVLSSIYASLTGYMQPSLKKLEDYGDCSEAARTRFLFGVDTFAHILKNNSDVIEKGMINFEVNHDLFKGYLLAEHQIVETSRHREKVMEVDKAFNFWLSQIKAVIGQANSIVRDGPDTGPQIELEYWRTTLIRFSSIVEFTESRAFQNYLKCLELSRSKLVEEWKHLEDTVHTMLIEARDNVRFLSSIEKHWTPLYLATPQVISNTLTGLLSAFRAVFINSNFFNTSVRISGLLSKVVNQLIVASQKFITENGSLTIWDVTPKNLMKKIEECKLLKEAFQTSYLKVVENMAEVGEPPFGCSQEYLFRRFERFEIRLLKIYDILDIMLRYRVLDLTKIAGMDPYWETIKAAYKIFSEKKYDPLAYHDIEFDADYSKFIQEVQVVEHDMKNFVKSYLKRHESVDQWLLTIKRFERLNLSCLHLDRRYLDVAKLLETEMEMHKNEYDNWRGSPDVRNIPPAVANIKWSRSVLSKMKDPIDVLSKRDCVIRHPHAQTAVKCYNSLSEVLIHYEVMQHKAWFTYASQVKDKMETTLIRKNMENNHYEVNMDPYVYQVIREVIGMWKLGLEIPENLKLLAYCKNRVEDAYEAVKSLVKRNNDLRKSIYPQFVPLMRVQLVHLERVFAPALTSTTWLSLNLEQYFAEIRSVLLPMENFLKEACDINDAQIEVTLKKIEKVILVDLPDHPVEPQVLKDMNVEHRQRVEKKIEMRSVAAERAAVDLIVKFIDKSEVAHYDNSGKFELPANQITDSNWRAEELKPIDRYDWLCFEKIYKATGYATTAEENEKLCFKEYDGLKYDVTLLHIDCVELFSFYNNKIIASLVKCTKKSIEMLRKRSNMGGQISSTSCDAQVPLMTSEIVLTVPKFVLVPNMTEIQKLYDATMKNIIETNYAISTWGKQAKTAERKQRKPRIDEVRHERNWFRTISEHKEITRYMSFDSGVMQLEAKIKWILDDFLEKYGFLWDESREEEIEEFVKSNPLTVDIRDMLLQYDRVTEQITKLDKVICVKSIQIDCEQMIDALAEESKMWKLILGEKLSKFYRTIVEEMVSFIQTQLKTLSRELNVLDDCRIAMDCLKVIRENFIRIDNSLNLMEDTYAMFASFNISISSEETERVDGLRVLFTSMIKRSEEVGLQVIKLQVPLQAELIAGVEKFVEDLATFDEDFVERGPNVEGLAAKEASDRVIIFEARLDELTRLHEVYSSGERLFGMPVQDYPVLQKRKKDINFLNKLYKLYLAVNRAMERYSEMLFREVDMEAINTEIADFIERCRKMPRGMKDWPAFIDLKQKIDDFSECCPLLESMVSTAIKERHWTMLENVMNYEFNIHDEHFTLGFVLQAPLLEFKDDIEEICGGAIKEQDIDMKLQGVIRQWKEINIPLATFKNRGELLIKASDMQDIIAILEESLMTMGQLASNRFNAPFKKDIMLMLTRLSNTNEIIERWLQVQYLWMYLEAVFVSGDISRQLPMEAKRFSGIDKGWVRIMMKARDTSNLLELCTGDDIVETTLKFLLEQLEACQKALTGYLETKRLIFPRFFFVSDPVLLEILGQASNPASIQPHLLSIFDGVARVEFDPKHTTTVIAMHSSNNERVPLLAPVKCSGSVEIWIGKLLEMVQDTMRSILGSLGTTISDPKFSYQTALETLCGQAQLICIQLVWTKDAEYALNSGDKKTMTKKNFDFQAMLDYLVDQTVKDLTKLQRVSCETLVTIHVHQRDIFEDLIKNRVKSRKDFDWQKQARFYYDPNQEEILVKITDIDFIYQNEYLGVTERLAITPLTDRCYITLAQAIGMCMGGAPAGPAGTGKTETVKDMGRALGKLVVVFNCSDQMDFRGLGRIYKGLAQSGSWGCFDEFNRIELPVLSVAAQQIYIVLNAKKQRKKKFIFSDGDTVKMNPEFGLFITMNPGYAGRQELPENLKIQFRTVAMMVPDRQIIMRVKLASCGFRDNVKLASKFFTLYKLCEEQLSKQVHYDFGLRNILSCLRTLGAVKRAAGGKLNEDEIVMQVLRDMNLSKLVDEDEPLFLSLISDLFPGLKLQTASQKELQSVISKSVEKMQLINEPAWNLKIVQLYETSLVRHGLMVLGPTGAGKTKCMNTLLESLTSMGLPHKEIRMNPKAITAPQMFGRLDVTTNDWTDGIFSVLWRRTLKFKQTDFVWLVLDGPVDAVWIENLNSVLDDNKTLTLANGDRIVMSANCKLVFEPDAIDNASPATVSRMGMVFMSSSVMPWNTILEGWLLSRPADQVKAFRKFFGKIYGDLHLFVQTKLEAKMKILEAIYIRQTCDLLAGLLEDESFPEAHLEKIFLFAVMWSLGAVLELDDREKMESFVMNHPSKLKWPKIEPGESIFEFLVTKDGQWSHWNTQIDEYTYPSDSVPDYSGILVPNVDNVRTAFLLQTIAKQFKSVLLIGEQGTAKTVMIKSFLANYDPEYHLSKSFNFSSATTPGMFQRIIESYVEKRVGSTYGPSQMRRMTIFIDDINMPLVNEWGDQVTNEIVRQLMESTGFYNLDRPGDFSTILDVQLVGAMIHPGGGRNDIPPRLKRQFNIFNCTLPSNKSMDKIFSVIGNGYFCPSRFNEEVVDFVSKLIPLTRLLWQQTKIKMLPTPRCFHYVFNLRDLSRIWGGMLKIKREECQNISSLLKLWRHECTRVIADRFTSHEDNKWFRERMKLLAKQELDENYSDYPRQEPYFVDFLRDPPEVDGADMEDEEEGLGEYFIYEEIPSFEAVNTRVYNFMNQYNIEIRGSKLDMVFFQDALIHLMIVSRILRTPRGNALLVGVGGSGKQSLTKLASFIAGFRTHQIVLTRAYNIGNFADEFKFLYRFAGVSGQGISFIFTDNDIKDESFLEYLNNVLSSGEIANLFAKDEIDEINEELIPIMKKVDPKRIPTQDNLYDFFITRARNNIHIVLCFSPVGEKFRNRSLKFPGLISGCSVDWFQKWPKDALIAVSQHFLQSEKIECKPQVKQELIEIMAFVQDNVSDVCTDYFERYRRQTHVTPKSFLSFLEGYKSIYRETLASIVDQSEKMTNGLGKLEEAAISIDILKKEFQVMAADILEKEIAAQEVIVNVQESQAFTEAATEEVNKKKVIQDALVTKINAAKAIAEQELEKTLPQLELAEAALKTVKSQDIATVRRLGKPPHLITVIMDVVLILFRKKLETVKPDKDRQFLVMSWSESLKMMADVRFLANIIEFKRDTIDAETLDLMQPYFNFPNYTEQAAFAACGNVAGLLKWTKAMADFYLVNKDVLPLKADLAIKEAQAEKAKLELAKLEEAVAIKQQELAEATALLEIANQELQIVKDNAALLQSKLDAAQAMITGLADEKARWTEQVEQFEDEINRLVGDVLVLTGFLSYTGPFNSEFRSLLQKNWQEELLNRRIPFTSTINAVERLTDTATIGEWNLQGLPNDELSIQNGIIVTQAARYPLLIDPQSQGKAWIKQKEKENLIVTTLVHKFFRNHLEDAVQQGLPMLIEDVGEELDPCLDNILEKNYIKVGNSMKVKIGDKEIDTSPDFRLFITTKLPNPMYTPEIAARTSIIDFAVTAKGLEDQLLGRVILSERNEIEAERVQLETDVTANKKLSKELEANLLYKLSTTEGSLLDDITVMEVLNTSKAKAIEIREKLESAEQAKESINRAREEFRPVASRGSVLYFLVVKMTLVNSMYQTSLGQFLERFDYSLANADRSPITPKRINAIIEFLSFDIFKYKSRGLYETHKFLFVLLMTLDIDLQRGRITFEEFQNLIKGGAALDINACPPKTGKWITDSTWLNLVQLSSLKQFNKILTQLVVNEKAWKQWYSKNEPEEEVIPDGYSTLDAFQRLLIIRSFCLDRALSQCRKYIGSSLGAKYEDPVVLDYDDMLEESRTLTPIICFLSMGSDPTPAIEALAKKNQVKVSAISMGQGQEVHARKLMLKSLEEGSWVLLQNCHLGLEYMNELTLQLLELEQAGEGYAEMFRLWITTEVHPQFPISLLQISIKFTNEPPSGVRAGLKRTYNSMSSDVFDHSDSQFYLPFIYSVSFLHTIVQERRKFGALGWNIPYEFNSSDWLASCYFIQKHVDDLDEDNPIISWKTVNYMIGEVQYGGRVTDDYDKRLLITFAKTYFQQEMFAPTFEFFRGYNIVVEKTPEDYLEYFDTMAPTDPPNVYGLHANADITYQTNKTTEILDTILSVQPKESAGSGGETREAAVERQVNEMLTRIPPPYDEFEVKQRLTKDITPMNIFLRQEIDRIQKIILLVKATLSDLLLAIEGTIIMNEQLRDAFDNIYDARVPKVWQRGSWTSSTLGFWFTELIERNNQFTTWCFKGRPNVFWMTGFFNPQGFLTAMRQETARAQNGWALDKVILQNEVMKLMLEDCKDYPKTGVYVHGLYLDGAGWNRKDMKLGEATNKVLYTLMPVIRIYANTAETRSSKQYECPVYKKSNRTDLNFITALNLPSAKHPDHWILRGVALLCDIK